MSALIECLRHHGERIAVLTDTEQLTYDELAVRVADAAHTFGEARRLVLLETRNDISTLVHYLGALAAGNVVLPVPAGRDHSGLEQTYDPTSWSTVTVSTTATMAAARCTTTSRFFCRRRAARVHRNSCDSPTRT